MSNPEEPPENPPSSAGGEKEPPSPTLFYWLFVHYLFTWNGKDSLPYLIRNPVSFFPWFQRTLFWRYPSYLAKEGYLLENPHWERLSQWGEKLFLKGWEVFCEIREEGYRKGIPVAPLKGLYTHRYYPEKGLRLFTDLDLYVSRENLMGIREILKKIGYRPYTPLPPEKNFEWNFLHPNAPSIDLHYSLTLTYRLPYSFPPPEEMKEEDHALHALAHFAQHKGYLLPYQEGDLLLFTITKKFPNPLPLPFHRIWNLWVYRLRKFFFIRYPSGKNPLSLFSSLLTPILYRGSHANPHSPFPRIREVVLTPYLYPAILPSLLSRKKQGKERFL